MLATGLPAVSHAVQCLDIIDAEIVLDAAIEPRPHGLLPRKQLVHDRGALRGIGNEREAGIAGGNAASRRYSRAHRVDRPEIVDIGAELVDRSGCRNVADRLAAGRQQFAAA